MQDIPSSFSLLMVQEREKMPPVCDVQTVTLEDLPPGEVVIQVEYSSLNYKDALACQGHPGVVKQLPHVPGIDLAGRVVTSSNSAYQPGDQVLVTGYQLGAEAWGGFTEYARVPAEWIVPMPEGMNARYAMTLGTAGFTAAQCVTALVEHRITPDRGPVVVTGATGGVGMWSVALLSQLGYQVTAVTGKEKSIDLLKKIGATEVVGRDVVKDETPRPLLAAQWAGAVDTVGGQPLTTIVRSLRHRGCVAACGLAAGSELPLTVHPFILRGVTLAGIDSAKCPREPRLEMWEKLAGPWRVELPAECIDEIPLAEVPVVAEAMLTDAHRGRTLVVPGRHTGTVPAVTSR